MATWAAGSVEVRPAPWAMCPSAQNPSWETIRAVLLPNFWEGYGKKKSEEKKRKKKVDFYFTERVFSGFEHLFCLPLRTPGNPAVPWVAQDTTARTEL